MAVARGWERFLPSIYFVQTVVTFLQYTALILAVDVNWPSFFRDAIGWSDTLLLDYRLGTPGVAKLDFRAHFLALGPAPAVAASLVALLSFRSTPVVLWYFALLLSLVLLAAGFAVKLLPSNAFTADAPTDVFFWSGVAGVAACAGLYVAWRWAQKQRRLNRDFEDVPLLPEQIARMVPGSVAMRGPLTPARVGEEGDSYGSDSDLWESDSDDDVDDRAHDRGRGRGRPAATTTGYSNRVAPAQQPSAQPPSGGGDSEYYTDSEGGASGSEADSEFDRYGQLRGDSAADRARHLAPRPVMHLLLHLLLAVCMLAAGIAGIITSRRDDDITGPLESTAVALGITAIVVGSLLLVHWAMMLTRPTRRLLWRAQLAYRTVFVALVVIALAALAVPVAGTVLAAMHCVEASCPPGETFPDKDIRLDGSAVGTLTSTARCITCPYTNCPGDLGDLLCNGDDGDSLRLGVDHSLSCRRHVLPYLTPAAVVLFVGFSMTMPLLMARLARAAEGIASSAGHPPGFDDGPGAKTPTDGVRVRIGLGGVGGDAGRAAGIGLVRSSVTGIVRPFAAGWSVWAAGLCVEGLLLAVISLFVTNVPAALGLTIALHLASTVPQLPMTRALLSQTHRFLALGCRLALVCLALFGILLDTGSVSNPDTGGAIIVALMFALPLLGLVVGAVLELRVDKCVTQCLEGDFQSLATTNAVRKQAIVMGFAAAKRREIESEERARISEYKRSKLASLSKDPAAVAEHHDEDAAMFDEDEDIPRDPHLESLRATDRALDRLGADFITSYFMFVGVVAFLALCIVLVGIVYASTTSEFIPQAPLTSSSDPAFINNHEFANYADWTEFRQECCCSVGTPTPKYPIVEHWGCRNSFTKMKARSASLSGSEADRHGGASHSGLALRGLCSTTFAPGVCADPYYEVPDPTLPVAVQEDYQFYRVDVCNASSAAANVTQTSAYAFHRLW